jgi:hypothetical protein
MSHELITTIRCVPLPTHLQITRCYSFDDVLIGALHYIEGVTPLAPHLHNLVLEDPNGRLFTQDILVDMITSRWWTDTELASRLVPPAVARWTVMQLRGDFSESFVDMMQVLRPQGLRLLIRGR